MFICIWCEDLERGIGLNQKIPWINKIDLELFKTITLGNVVCMGKNTYINIDKPLVNRKNYVFSKTLNFYNLNPGFCLLNDVDKFISKYKDSKEVFYIIGGKQIYNKFLQYSKILIVSKLDKSYNCNLFMDNNFIDFNLHKVFFFDDFNCLIYVNKEIK